MNRRSLVLSALVASSCYTSAISYNAALDFSTSDNPNGTWSYGWRDTAGFHLFTERNEVAPGVYFWKGGDGPLGEPTAGKNVGANSIQVSPTMHYGPGEFSLHPGSSGQQAVLRWTSPETRRYDIDSIFTGVDPVGTTTDIHIWNGATGLASGMINGANSVVYSGSHFIQEGEHLEFLVGYGNNGTFWYDTTRVDVTISTVPETANPIALLGTACAALWVGRKRVSALI